MARHIACQTLLNGDPLKYGWLRRQDFLHQKVKLNLVKTIRCNRALPRLPPGAQQVMPCTSKKPKGPLLKPLAPVAAQLGSDDDGDGDIEYTDMRCVEPRPPVTSSKKQRPDVPKKPSMVVLPRVVRPGAKRETEDVVAAAMWTGGAKEGHDLISHCCEDGVYLLRKSTQCKGQLTLVSHVGGMAKKYKIDELAPGSNQFTLDVSEPVPRYFTGMSQLVRHYMKEPLPSPGQEVRLSKPFSELTK